MSRKAITSAGLCAVVFVWFTVLRFHPEIYKPFGLAGVLLAYFLPIGLLAGGLVFVLTGQGRRE